MLGGPKAWIGSAPLESEIRNALHFVIRQFYIEMLLHAGEQTERLQAVDAEFFEEVIVWRQALPWDFKLRGCQLQNFIQSLLLRLQRLLLGCSVPASPSLWRIR